MCDEKTKALDTGSEINMNSPGLRAVFSLFGARLRTPAEKLGKYTRNNSYIRAPLQEMFFFIEDVGKFYTAHMYVYTAGVTQLFDGHFENRSEKISHEYPLRKDRRMRLSQNAVGNRCPKMQSEIAVVKHCPKTPSENAV